MENRSKCHNSTVSPIKGGADGEVKCDVCGHPCEVMTDTEQDQAAAGSTEAQSQAAEGTSSDEYTGAAASGEADASQAEGADAAEGSESDEEGEGEEQAA